MSTDFDFISRLVAERGYFVAMRQVGSKQPLEVAQAQAFPKPNALMQQPYLFSMELFLHRLQRADEAANTCFSVEPFHHCS